MSVNILNRVAMKGRVFIRTEHPPSNDFCVSDDLGLIVDAVSAADDFGLIADGLTDACDMGPVTDPVA